MASILIYVKSHPQTVPRGPNKTPVGASVILFGTQAGVQIHWDSSAPRVSCCMARIELPPQVDVRICSPPMDACLGTSMSMALADHRWAWSLGGQF